MRYVIAYDLGTGGLKSSLFDENGVSVASDFKSCETYYPTADFREQRPLEWWNMVVRSTKDLLTKLEEKSINSRDIAAAAFSGHSLGVVPIGMDGSLLLDSVPVWFDARASKQAAGVFTRLDEEKWYLTTGNGFPAHLYGAFKILWYKENMPDVYRSADKFIGTKDYLNYKLTGALATDYSYASGSGVYDLEMCAYRDDYIEAFGLEREKFPEPRESASVLGRIKKDAALELGLPDDLLLASGGVDNACMAAGAGCVKDGMAYTSLGTSAWVAVSSHKPVVNFKTKPFVFGHLIKGMYASAEPLFSAGNTFRWVRDILCADLKEIEASGGEDAYKTMDRLAAGSPVGANGLCFTPTLAGGSALDRCAATRGAIVGLDLMHTRGDVIRAALEGVCLGLRMSLEELRKEVSLSDEMLIVGGGSKSPFWRQMFANIYGMDITESAVGENAGSLGAMACAAISAGMWKDFTPLIGLNKPISVMKRNPADRARYEAVYDLFLKVSESQNDIAEYKEKISRL
ncbi:MAG: hypothetical protein LBS35_03545 [Synergistaceae bacterium]|jgi:xylulokinase|nr:hypothetical protein [Synergistaceae bacterium]